MNTATQTAIGFALSLLLDTPIGEDVPAINLKKVFSTCRDKFCSINGAPVGRILDESMRQEHAMLAQTETKSKAFLAAVMVGRINPMVQKEVRKAEEGPNCCTTRNFKSQEPTKPSQGEHREGTC